MKRYKLKAVSKAIVIIDGIAYSNGEKIDLELDENEYNGIKDFVDVENLVEIGNESNKVDLSNDLENVEKPKPNKKGADKKAQEIKEENDFGEDDFLKDFDSK